MAYPEHSNTTLVEIFLQDLTEKAQARIAEELNMTVAQIWADTNWDFFPMATFEVQKGGI